MYQRLQSHIQATENFLSQTEHSLSQDEWESKLQNHLQQIQFFQHERLIHLLVTLAVVFLSLGGLILLIIQPSFPLILLEFFFLLLLFPYLLHYRRLENGVQTMYLQYDRYLKKITDRKAQDIL